MKRTFSDSEGDEKIAYDEDYDYDGDYGTDKSRETICIAPDKFVVKRQPSEPVVVLTKKSDIYGDFRSSLGRTISTTVYDGIKGETFSAGVYFTENGVEKKLLIDNPVLPMQVTYYHPKSENESAGRLVAANRFGRKEGEDRGSSVTTQEGEFVMKNAYEKETTWYFRDVRNGAEWKHDSVLTFVTEPQLERSKGRMVFGHPALAGFARGAPIVPIELEFSGPDDPDAESSFWMGELEKDKKWVHASFRKFENETVRMLASIGVLEYAEGFTVIPRS